MGLLVAIEGIDGSGKGTQAQRLQSRLQADGVSAALLSFPRYEATHFGRRIGEFLNGRFGSLDDVSPFLAALLYAGDRFESRDVIEDALRDNDLVICDRYVSSNIAHQGAKLSDPERQELIDWVETTEFQINGLPRPDLVIYLDLPATVAQDLIAKKSARNYTDKAADLHEADGGYLARVAEVYRTLAENETNWLRIPCLENGQLRTIEAIGNDIAKAVREQLKAAR